MGIEWADRKHDVCLQVPGLAQVEASVLEHRPKAIEAWAQRARRETIVAFLHAHSVRRSSVIDRRLEAMRTERPFTSDAAVIEPARLLVEALLPQLRAVSAGISRLEMRSPGVASNCRTFVCSQGYLAQARSSPRA